ncbi:hypothetical protein CSKR_110208 [Clonorchis sinensis]|uniref:ATP-binding cassette transporter n=1 Tax=Clonorchis sinensis TaxID=79923 RepID=A0A419PQW4_CLOSI|nr:hypothetical protein CSKR_110208 [Clonorchis sinensis]
MERYVQSPRRNIHSRYPQAISNIYDGLDITRNQFRVFSSTGSNFRPGGSRPVFWFSHSEESKLQTSNLPRVIPEREADRFRTSMVHRKTIGQNQLEFLQGNWILSRTAAFGVRKRCLKQLTIHDTRRHLQRRRKKYMASIDSEKGEVGSVNNTEHSIGFNWFKQVTGLKLGQPGSIPALVQPSDGMAARPQKGATAERREEASTDKYRGIGLLCTVGNRIVSDILEENIHEWNYGLRNNRSMNDLIFAAR